AAPRRRDELIEFLHRIQDSYGSLSAAHLVALAQELKLAMTEVYEVATFYHHFDVVKEGEQAPPRITVRVCETLSCALAGGEQLIETAKRTFGPDVRVLPAPCIGRCEHAPAAVVGRHTIDQANVEKLSAAIAAWAVGIDAVYIYLRDEYAGCREILTRELAARRADPPGELPKIELRRGAGAYICGEESAMIESIEGKRGMPRLRPPYVAQVG